MLIDEEKNMNNGKSWENLLASIMQENFYSTLKSFVDLAYQTTTCFPQKEEIFEAFHRTAFEDVKVVILGQDPYHGEGQAHGLSFSVRQGRAIPPSLNNIFKELRADLNLPLPSSGDLTRWAEQGVFLLNATLTVEAHKAGSHQGKGWEQFTDHVIGLLSDQRKDLVFLLWGGFAKKKAKLIDASKHYVLTSGHPSPLSANRGYWFGNKHFSQTNEYLKSSGKSPINW